MKIGFLASSVDPNEVALTIKGLGLSLVPLIIITLRVFNISVAETLLSDIIVAFSGAVAAIMVFVGLIRKLIIALDR